MKLRALLKFLYTALLLPLLKLAVKTNRDQVLSIGRVKVQVYKGMFSPARGISSIVMMLVLLRRLRSTSRSGYIFKIADLCCGSGILGVTSAHARGIWCVLVDVSLRAVRAARASSIINNVYHRVDIVCTYCLSCFRYGIFDLVVVNPPYLPCPYASDQELCCHLKGEILVELLYHAYLRLRRNGEVLVALSNISPIDLKSICMLVEEQLLGPDKLLVFLCTRKQLLRALSMLVRES